jgi:hypothetical protein
VTTDFGIQNYSIWAVNMRPMMTRGCRLKPAPTPVITSGRGAGISMGVNSDSHPHPTGV